MTTLKQRMREYWQLRDFPTTPDSYESSTLRTLAGTGIVIATGFILTFPFILGLFAAARAGLIPYSVAGVLGLGLYPVSGMFSKYVGAPLADHVLDIPREVP